MTYAEYDALPGTRSGHLGAILESPALYRWQLDHPSADTEALALGRLVHVLALEPSALADSYAVWRGGDRRGGAWKDFQAEHAGRTILRECDLGEALDMANAVRTHPLVTPYLTGGQFETPLRWTDLETGLPCKARMDWLQPKRRVLLDLKTTRSIEATRFGWDSYRYGYPRQLAFYGQGVEAALGWAPEKVVIVAVEKRPPYEVAVFELGPEVRQHGASEVARALALLRRCLDRDEWPGRYIEEQQHAPPPQGDDIELDDLPEED